MGVTSEEDFIIDNELGKIIIKEIAEMKDSAEQYEKSNKKHIPLLEKYKFLNFKGIKKISFDNYKKQYPPFNWGDIMEFYGLITAEEAHYRSTFEWEATEYFYTNRNRITPFVFTIINNRYNKKFITDLFSILDPPRKAFKCSQDFGAKDINLSKFTLMIEKDLVLYYDDNDLNFYFNPEKHLIESDNNPFYRIIKLLMGYTNRLLEENKIHVVYKGEYGFDKLAFDVKKIDIDIKANYNDDFFKISEDIIKNLNNTKQSGLYILSGEPGVGKTSFVRFLSGKVKRNIIFVSPDMVNYITDPSFIPFLMNNSDSVLIIEDAEPALQKRDGSGRTGAISNILNLTDGLLSDCLNISIVATFNTNTKNIDDALLREGRLINSYTFNKLSTEKSKNLLKKLGYNIKVTNPMTLAEIYSYGKDNNKGSLFKNDKKIGFGI